MPGDNNLHKAANKGDLEECKKYVEGLDDEDAIDVNEPGASDRRALHRAAGAGHLPVVEYLVEKGATIDLVS
jgi:ankyrin repeat protein